MFLVAITLIGTVTIGVFAVAQLNQLTLLHDPPQVSLAASADAKTDRITLKHTDGDPLDSRHTRIIVRNDSATVAFQSTHEATALKAGDWATIDLRGDLGFHRVDWDPRRAGWEYTETSGFDGIESTDEYTVIFVDTRSQVRVFETTVQPTPDAPTMPPRSAFSLAANETTNTIQLQYRDGPGLASSDIQVTVTVNNATYVFAPTTARTILASNHTAVISTTRPGGVDAGPDTIDWDQNTPGVEYTSAPDNGLPGIDAGDTINVTLVDMTSETTVYNGTVIAE